MAKNDEQSYWSQRYLDGHTGWNIGYPSTPIKTYVDQLDNKDISILIPGAGNAYEAEYLWEKGFRNVDVLDIASHSHGKFQAKKSKLSQRSIVHGGFFFAPRAI